MRDVENTGSRAETVDEPVTRALRSAQRSLLWAGLNRYFAPESERDRTLPLSEKAKGEQEPEWRDSQ